MGTVPISPLVDGALKLTRPAKNSFGSIINCLKQQLPNDIENYKGILERFCGKRDIMMRLSIAKGGWSRQGNTLD
jgi:hypothetical protein